MGPMESHFLIYKIIQFVGPNFFNEIRVDRKKKSDQQLTHPNFALERSGSSEMYLYRVIHVFKVANWWGDSKKCASANDVSSNRI